MGERIIKILNSAVNIAALFCFVICIVYGVYGIWDSNQVKREADSSRYQKYQPREKGKDQFAFLQRKNPEVIGWIKIDGTKINYPIAQSVDNKKYVNTNAEGEYSQSGSVFLDYRNKKDFSMWNNILYGHHMEDGKMFGDLDKFLEQKFFETHQTGKIYYEGKYHQLNIIGIIKTNAYDRTVYDPIIETNEQFHALEQQIKANSVFWNEQKAGEERQLILLSTCDKDQTDGRIILVTQIMEK